MSERGNSVQEIQAIDVHGHYGIYVRKGLPSIKNQFMSGDAATVAARARRANTQWTIVSPLTALLPRFETNVIEGNEEAARVVPRTDGLLQWVVINPLETRSYEQANTMLGNAGYKGYVGLEYEGTDAEKEIPPLVAELRTVVRKMSA